jgi:putative thiamine transport system permease protein
VAALGGGVAAALYALAVGAVLGIALWSVAQTWRFPNAWPSAITTANWARQLGDLQRPAFTTVVVGVASTLIALVLTVACLENETTRQQPGAAQRGLALLYLPLLIPQVAFLFGAQVR